MKLDEICEVIMSKCLSPLNSDEHGTDNMSIIIVKMADSTSSKDEIQDSAKLKSQKAKRELQEEGEEIELASTESLEAAKV